MAGLRSAILAAACIVGGVIAVIQGGAPALWMTLFGLAIVLQEIVKAIFGPNPISQPMPASLRGAAHVGTWIGLAPGALTYPWWRLTYFLFSVGIIGAVFAFLSPLVMGVSTE